MGAIKPEDFKAVREWALGHGMQDINSLVVISGEKITFRSANAGKAYRRIEKQYKETVMEAKRKEAAKDV